MKQFVNLEKLDRLDHLIRMQSTGTPGQLANRLEFSLSTLHEYKSYLQNVLKAPIWKSGLENRMLNQYKLYLSEPEIFENMPFNAF